MNELVRTTVETLRNVAGDSGIELVIAIPERLPEVMGDADRLSQVLTNLIDNAIKFTPRGGRITTRAHVSEKRMRTYGPYDEFKGVESDTPESGPYLVVEVHDDGIGIPLEHQQRIFEKFGQVGNVMTDKPEGTGLGLAISGNIMVQHGGALWVESAPGEGTSMLFSAPLMVVEEPVEPAPPEMVPTDEPIGNPEDLVEALGRVAVAKRILVVDDDPRTISGFADLLEPLGYRAVGCHSGQAAIERARDLRPGCVVLDLVRLDGNGHEVLRMLKSDPDTSSIPVVVLTRGDDDYRARELGASAIVRKPVKPTPVLAR
jgi:CheY-like chemotaxis protein